MTTGPGITMQNAVALMSRPISPVAPTDGQALVYVAATGLYTPTTVGSGSGTVTSITQGTGMSFSVSPITSTGTINLANTAVTPASYTNANITVDQQGRITAASNGSAGVAVTVIKIQKFIDSGTYTADAHLLYAIIECVGNGAGGGGVTSTTTNGGCAGGGGGGSYARATVSAATVGVSQTVTFGATGTGGAAGNNSGTAGGDVSVGSLCIGKGGSPGTFANQGAGGTGGAGGVAGTGDVTIPGSAGGNGANFAAINGTLAAGTGGAAPVFGTTTPPSAAAGNASGAGTAGNLYGSGGSGAYWDNVAASNKAGGTGATGIVVITEYCSQ